MTDLVQIAAGFLVALTSSAVFILALFIGFCTIFGFIKLKKTTGRSPVIKSLDEVITGEPMVYLPPTAPRGPADQLRAPELLDSSARRS